ncbi:MAG: prepilin-type N-terminal cleavage/methylation domain-containing protein [Piscirickettsiaceae bacterium]|nr:prepilin-type N-terminal cleavage/methylation domain-containing protein [Piscirickettsiaceae bacterium]
MRRVNSGFSLIELSIVLVIIGGIVISQIKMFPQLGKFFFTNEDGRATTSVSAATSDALLGFIIANDRLPCPDSGNDGLEDCAAAVQRGNVPYKTLNLPHPVINSSGQLFEYAVYRKANTSLISDIDLATLKNRYEPLLPSSELSVQSNGLDFCFALQQAITSNLSTSHPYLGTGNARLNMAFILADPGASNADNSGNLFDQANGLGLAYELATRPHDLTYDDRVYGMAFTELAGRLQCAQQLAEVNGAAREAFAAQDMKDLALYYQSYRVLSLDLSQGNVNAAEFKLAMTVVDTLILATSIAITLALAAETAGGVTAAVVIPAGIAAGFQVHSLTVAAIGLADANTALEQAKLLKEGADSRVTQLTNYAASTLLAAKYSDQKGSF